MEHVSVRAILVALRVALARPEARSFGLAVALGASWVLLFVAVRPRLAPAVANS